ncbi:MAG: HD domain-containing protein [Desulfobacterales bacterium]|jgi:putative nucleotidyltransferase with HDIG domain|nr:HD domain-containing protein [Desulfobacterales bacterium]
MKMPHPHNLLLYPATRAGVPGLRPTDTKTALSAAALTLFVESQDAYTREHGRRVAAYAERIARQLGLAQADVEAVRCGGLLHDIGKIAFSPNLVCNTQTTLSAAMRAEIRRHPEIGRAILETLHVARPVVECVHYHHERLDGSGYPCGLAADRIPLGAQIISVADCFDALTTDRPYQKGKRPEEALSILETLAGRALSAELIQALCRELPPAAGASAAHLHSGRTGLH